MIGRRQRRGDGASEGGDWVSFRGDEFAFVEVQKWEKVESEGLGLELHLSRFCSEKERERIDSCEDRIFRIKQTGIVPTKTKLYTKIYPVSVFPNLEEPSFFRLG